MTWKLTIRGDVSGYTRAEYRCPVHGVFEAVVARDENGDPPDETTCPTVETEWSEPGMGEPVKPIPVVACSLSSPWTITSAPGLAFQRGCVRQGKVEEAPHPLACDTRELGEGMPLDEWKAKRAKLWNDHDFKQFKEDGI